MKYNFYLRIKLKDGEKIIVGDNHELLWDNRDLVKASSGWIIMNNDCIGMSSDILPKLHKGILELTNNKDAYYKFELSNGIGTLNNVLSFYQSLLKDCQQHPYAELCGKVSD